MSDSTFDPKSVLDAYRSALAPVVDRVGRYQYAVAGDYLEWSLAQAKLALSAHTPADFFTKQVELTTALSEKLRARAQEFTSIALDAQAGVADSIKSAAAPVGAAKPSGG